MRNDARPVGHDQPPVPHHRPADESRQTEVKHGDESHVIDRGEDARPDDEDVDPVTPTAGSSPKTGI